MGWGTLLADVFLPRHSFLVATLCVFALLPTRVARADDGDAPPATVAPQAFPQTRWEPFDREVQQTAEGSLDACETVLLPVTILPVVGDVVGTVAEWACIVPAAMAVDHVGAFHGNRESHFWQPGAGLLARTLWVSALDTPLVVLTVAAVLGGAAGGAALVAWAGMPIWLTVATMTAAVSGTYLVLRAGREGVGDFLFELVYDALTPEVDDARAAQLQTESWTKPGERGFIGGFGLIATVAGTKPRFDWSYVVPVVGPLARSAARADEIRARVRRYGRETLQEDKKHLEAMDATTDVLAFSQGWAGALGQAGLLTSGVLLAAGYIATAQGDRSTGDALGVAALVAAASGAVGVTAGSIAEKLQPVLVPAAYALAE